MTELTIIAYVILVVAALVLLVSLPAVLLAIVHMGAEGAIPFALGAAVGVYTLVRR